MASRFWVGGTGTWDSTTTTHWSASTGGAGGASAPSASDTVTIDASSGAGTITVDSTLNGATIGSITCGAMGMTLDFSVNNPSMTMGGLTNTGTGTRTLKMGSGTFTFTGGNSVVDFTTVTGLTFDCGTSTFAFAGSSSNRSFLIGAGLTFGNISITTGASFAAGLNITGNSTTFASLSMTAPGRILFNVSVTISNAFTLGGTDGTHMLFIESANNPAFQPTITITSGTATCNWCGIQGLAFTGGATFTATNSFGAQNSGITITGPGSSGSHMIGG